MRYKIDLQKIADELDFDLEDIEMLMGVFLEGVMENMSELKNGIDTNDLESVSNAAHAIKGSAANLTLIDIANISKEIESAAKTLKEFDYLGKYKELDLLIKAVKA